MIKLPPELSWAAYLTGQKFPDADETSMSKVADAWLAAAQQLGNVDTDLNDVAVQMSGGLSGAPAEAFGQYVAEFQKVFPTLADGANELGAFVRQSALNVEYAKYMIIIQLIWMTEQIYTWINTLWGAAIIPEIIAAGTVTIRMILRQLLISVAAGTAINTLMDVAVQALQFLKGDRTHWDSSLTKSSAEGGAIGGGVGGILHGAVHIGAPSLFQSTLGHVAIGAVTGVAGAEVTNLALNANTSLAFAAAAGGAAGLLGSRGGHGAVEDAPPPSVDVHDIAGLKDLVMPTDGTPPPDGSGLGPQDPVPGTDHSIAPPPVTEPDTGAAHSDTAPPAQTGNEAARTDFAPPPETRAPTAAPEAGRTDVAPPESVPTAASGGLPGLGGRTGASRVVEPGAESVSGVPHAAETAGAPVAERVATVSQAADGPATTAPGAGRTATTGTTGTTGTTTTDRTTTTAPTSTPTPDRTTTTAAPNTDRAATTVAPTPDRTTTTATTEHRPTRHDKRARSGPRPRGHHRR